MTCDIVDLQEFYASTLGRFAERSISFALKSVWSPLTSERLVGLGYAAPYLDRLDGQAERALAFMPARQGAIHWPPGKPSTTAMVFDDELPLADSSVDRVLMVHGLEHTDNPRATLREVWRVVAPGGRLLLIIPNRRGLWARFEHTPFGYGQPYSKGQLTSILRETNFTPGGWSEALFFPPSSKRSVLRLGLTLEQTLRRSWGRFGGVIIVEAQKRLYRAIPVTKRQSQHVLVPAMVPQGNTARKLI